MRSDVLTKLELLDAKHVQDIVYQLKRLMSGLSLFHRECQEIMAGDPKLFPVEVDLNQSTCRPKEVDFDQDGYDEGPQDVQPEEIPKEFLQQPEQVQQEEALIDCSQAEAATAEPAVDLLAAEPSAAGDLLGGLAEKPAPAANLLGTLGEQADPADNLLGTLGQQSAPAANILGLGEQAVTAAAAEPAADGKDNWNENWLLGPNKEENVPKNIEPGGDIDLLLLDN